MTTIAIQDVLIPQREIERDLAACREAGIEPVRFGLIPFSDEITCDNPEDLKRPAIPFGSVKLIRLWQQGKTPAGWTVFYDFVKFDQRVWLATIGEAALNGPKMTRFTELGAIKDCVWKVPVFVKPTNDLKAFPGMVVNAGESIGSRLAQATQDSSLTDEQPILWAPIQEIACEFRCYMHDDQMIEASRYRTGLRADHAKVSDYDRSRLRDFTGHLAARFIPARFYAVDVAFMPDNTTKVVEYNCINCSGRYEANRAWLFKQMVIQTG